jgi:hypothetical protein
MLRKFGIIAVLSFIVAAVAAVPVLAANAHFVKEPVCTVSGTRITCTQAKVAGLGNEPVRVFYTAGFACETRKGNNQPGGHIQSQALNLTPRGGQITIPQQTLGPARCPGGLREVVTGPVTLTILNDAGGTVFSETIPLTT